MYEAIDTETGKKYALKKINKKSLYQSRWCNPQRHHSAPDEEAKIMRILDHQNIVRYHGHWDSKKESETKGDIYILMDRCKCSLSDEIARCKRIDESVSRFPIFVTIYLLVC